MAKFVPKNKLGKKAHATYAVSRSYGVGVTINRTLFIERNFTGDREVRYSTWNGYYRHTITRKITSLALTIPNPINNKIGLPIIIAR